MADSVYDLRLNFSCGGQFSTVIHHWKFDDAGFTTTQQAAAALIDAWDTGKRTALRACLPLATVLNSIKSRKVSGTGGFEAIKLISSSNAGSRGSPMMVAGVGGLIIWYPTGNARMRGKTFLPGIFVNDIADGITTSAYQSAIDSNAAIISANLVLTGGGAPTANMVIYSRSSHTSHAIERGYLSATVGTQRRRQRPA